VTDIAIIGSSPNALAAASRLVLEGKSVVVLEPHARVGGPLATEEFAPGFLANTGMPAAPLDPELDHLPRFEPESFEVIRLITVTRLPPNSPPTTPPPSEEYTRAGLPWFDYYAEGRQAVEGSGILAGIKSIFTLGKEKGDVPLPENVPVDVGNVIGLHEKPSPDAVREGAF
jgi:hypothetical protein